MLNQKILVPGLFILLLGSVVVGAYFYGQMLELKRAPAVNVEQVELDLIAKVGEIIVLPNDETPTIGTVADAERLKTQAFFANAKAGDKVLLYTSARKAILYDPVAHKIIEVAPINLGDLQSPAVIAQ